MSKEKVAIRLALIAGLSMLATGVYAQQFQAPPLKVMPLSGGVYWTSGGAGANTGFIVGTDGVIVIDAKQSADSAKEVLAEIAKITPKPVTHVILTHSDPDHVNGLVGFPKGLTIIAQENCKKEMEDSLNGPPMGAAPRDYLPTQVVSKNEDVTIDGVHLRLLHFAPAHTSGDLMIYLPDQKIVFAGDLLTLQFPYPLIHHEKNGSTEGWITNMKGIVALNADTFVPGHGDLQNKAAMQKKLTDVEARRVEVKKLFDAGKTLDEAKKALGEAPVPGAPAPRGYNPPSFTEVVYHESSEALPFNSHDFSGTWVARGGAAFTLSRTAPPMTPWAQARYDAAEPGLGPRGRPLGNDPMLVCDPLGFPKVLLWGVYPLEIVQTPDKMIMMFSWFYTHREIWTDGRKLPEDPDPHFYGYAVGHWDGDTLVVQSSGFDERTWLDEDGHPHSADMRLEERYRRVNHDMIEFTMTLTDPKAYTQPWVSEKKTLVLTPGDLDEDVCVPSQEARYKTLIREPAGGAGSNAP